MKKSFALLSTLFLLVIFSFLSINIIQNKSYNNNINKVKYLEIQAQIHLEYIIKNIKNNNTNIKLNDNRFVLNIYKENNNTNTIYHIYLKTNNDLNAHISLYKRIVY